MLKTIKSSTRKFTLVLLTAVTLIGVFTVFQPFTDLPAVSMTVEAAAPIGGGRVTTASSPLNVRATPNGTIIGSLPRHSYVILLGRNGDWFRVQMANGRVGYAAARYITQVSSQTARINTVRDPLNIRSGAGTNFGVITTLPRNSQVVVLGQNGAWTRILFAGNRVGFAYTNFLSIGGHVPPPPPPPIGFTPRTTAPARNDHRFTTSNPFHQAGFPMPNCTAYAWGRAYEILGRRPNLNQGNARHWFHNDGPFPNRNDNFQRGQTPRVGAIAVWANGSAGHVAVVEHVHANGNVDLSESFWRGDNFRYTRNVNVRSHRANFLGFIYLLP